MTKEEYIEGRKRNTVETIKFAEDNLQTPKNNRQKKHTLSFINHLKQNLNLIDSGEIWNETTEYYYNLFYKDAAYDYKIIAVD